MGSGSLQLGLQAGSQHTDVEAAAVTEKNNNNNQLLGTCLYLGIQFNHT